MSIFDDAWDDVKDVGKAAGSAVGGAAGAVFGTGSDPGLLGLSKQATPKHQIDKNNFTDPTSQAEQTQLQQQADAARNRQAPQAAGVTVGAYQNAATPQSAPYTGTGPIRMAQTANLGPASQSATATVNRSQDSQSRGYQAALEQSLQDQANGNGVGQKLAGQAYDQANDRSLKNAMALAASRRGIQPGPSLGAVLDSTAADRRTNAGTLSNAKLSAAMDAQKQLGDLSTATRGQDLSAETSQAGLDDAANARNQDANNTFGLTRFGAANDTSKFNAGAFNQNQQFNVNNLLNNNQFNANLGANVGMFNAGQQNQRTAAQAASDQATQEANLEAYLKNQGMNDEQAKAYTQMLLQKQEQDRQANEDYEQLLTQQELGAGALDQKAFEAARAARQAAVSGVADTATAAAGSGDGKGGSDIRIKREIKLLTPEKSSWRFSKEPLLGLSEIN